MKKILCIALVLAMALSLVACGDSPMEKLADKDDGTYYIGDEAGIEKLKASFNPLSPTNVFSSITFNEKMLYGDFVLPDDEKGIEAYHKEAVFQEVTYSETYWLHTAEENRTTAMLSTLPVALDAGPASGYYAERLRGEHEWASLYLLNERGYKIEVLCTYTVSGNTVSFFPLEGYEEIKNEEFLTEQILYTVGTESIDYTFERSATSLKLTRDGRSVTLKTESFASPDSEYLRVGGHAALNSPVFDNMDYFSATLSKKLSTVYIETIDGVLLFDSSMAVNENGQVSIYYETKDEAGNVTEHVKHFVCLFCDASTTILMDGEEIYYYTENSISRETSILGQGMTAEELDQLHKLSDSEIEQIVQKKEDLLTDLAQAYEDAGLNVSINTQTGEIALDTTVLFGLNESDISEDGKAFLQQFTRIYTDVVYSEKYAGFISRVVVEGHTDTSGSYELNQLLSQARADSVRDYCVSPECGVDGAYAQQFSQSLDAVGYAYDYPVYDADGQVDMDASRRVSFRFIISMTQGE